MIAAKEGQAVQAKLAELRETAKLEIVDPDFMPDSEEEDAAQGE